MGLGSPPGVSLARARERAQSARESVADGIDPIASKRVRRDTPTFGDLADAFIEDRKSTVRSDKSIARWKRAIGPAGYARNLRDLKVDQIQTEDVLPVLRSLWETHPASAGLLRGYIETVLNIAKVGGHRSGDYPAAWKGHLEHILPARQRLSRGHHAAMPFADIPAFFASLRANPSVAARALEFTILTAARTSETLKASWEEVDLASKVWTIPASRMKAAKEHRVPLSEPALDILSELGQSQGPVFPGRRDDMPLSSMAMDMVLRRMKVEVTVHGFRSSFRDWAGGNDLHPSRSRGGRSRSLYRQRCRARVSSRRCPREATSADGWQGRVLRERTSCISETLVVKQSAVRLKGWPGGPASRKLAADKDRMSAADPLRTLASLHPSGDFWLIVPVPSVRSHHDAPALPIGPDPTPS